MIIYPLPPAELDDKTLDKNIRAIAKTLCNVHYELLFNKCDGDLRLLWEEDRQKWINITLGWSTSKTVGYTKWASECRANYLKLVEMGTDCVLEQVARGIDEAPTKYRQALAWARDNFPQLACKCFNPLIRHPTCNESTPFPLMIAKKYWHYHSGYVNDFDLDYVESYRNYYRAKIKAQIHKLDNSIGCGCPECDKNFWDKYPKWTRRDKPSYLNEVGDGN
jgi:hypothetical protein